MDLEAPEPPTDAQTDEETSITHDQSVRGKLADMGLKALLDMVGKASITRYGWSI